MEEYRGFFEILGGTGRAALKLAESKAEENIAGVSLGQRTTFGRGKRCGSVMAEA